MAESLQNQLTPVPLSRPSAGQGALIAIDAFFLAQGVLAAPVILKFWFVTISVCTTMQTCADSSMRLQLEDEPAVKEDVTRQDELLLRKRGVNL